MISRRPLASRIALVAFTAVGLGGFVVGAASVAAGESCGNFDAVAAADGARIAVDSPGFLVIEHVDAGSPVAQAHLDSFGTSNAYAAYPDPGDEVLSLIPLIGSVVGADLPRNLYPLFAESTYPSEPEGRVTTPVVNLSATSAADTSRAVADSGVGASDVVSATALARASAAVDCASIGRVTATAENTVEALGLADGTLRVGRVYSRAEVVREPDGTQHVDSDLEIGRVTVLGVSVAITQNGLELGGNALPLANPVAEALHEQGIEIDYLEATLLDDGSGVIAPGIQIRVTRDLTGFAPTVTTLTLGRAFASVGLGSGGGGPNTPVATTPSSLVPSQGTVTPQPATISPPTSTTRAPAAGSTVPAVSEERADPVQSVAAVRTLFSSSGLYAVIVVASLTLLVGGLLFRKLGVRLGWN